MAIEILMPALSPTMTEGNLVKWLKKEEDIVKAGDILCEIETDKATMEVEAVDEGVLGKICVAEGSESVQVNTIIALLLGEGESFESLSEYSSLNAPVAKMPTQDVQGGTHVLQAHTDAERQNSTCQNATAHTVQERIFATPLAKRIAKDHQLALHTIQGTGPKGRIVKADVEVSLQKKAMHLSFDQQTVNFSNQSQSAHDMQLAYEDRKISLMRKTVAQRLSDSKRNVPHFYLSMDFELDALLALRKQINASSTDVKISVNDMLIKACAQALKDMPDANVTWHDTFIRYHKTVDISVAVAVDGGLITPIIFGAENKNISTIAQSVKHVVNKARAGQLKPHEYEGGTFTISNLGMYGVDHFSAILNPPQGCILAVGAGKKRPVVRHDALTVATVMTATLSVDHRSIDGVLAAQVLERIKHYVEHPVLMLI